MELLFANDAQSALAGSISDSQTTANLLPGGGAQFPDPNVGTEYFVGTFVDAATGLLSEIVWVTQRVGDTLTMVRAREGTSALSWQANDLFSNMWTAGQAATMVQAAQAQAQEYNFGLDSGSAGAYVCELDPEVTVEPGQGFPVRLFALNASPAGANTLDAGWGPVPIKRRDGSNPIGGEIIANHFTDLVFNADAGYWEIMQAAPATPAAMTAGTDTFSFVTPSQYGGVPTGAMMPFAGLTAPSGWYLCYGQTANRTTDAALFAAITRSATVTINLATPGVVTWVSHGLTLGDVVSFETTGALPTGLSVGTDYYAAPINANTFNVATSAANADAGVFVATSVGQSGTQTCRQNPFGCGNGTTTFGLPDARDTVLAGWTAMGGSARNLLGNNDSIGGFATAAMGNFAGQKAHIQTEDEVGEHDHAPTDNVDGGTPISTTGTTPQGSQTGNTSNLYNVNRTGINQAQASVDAANVTQPTLLTNVIIKR